MSRPRIAGFRLRVYIFKDAEVVDFAAPYGVLSVARRVDPPHRGGHWFLIGRLLPTSLPGPWPYPILHLCRETLRREGALDNRDVDRDSVRDIR